MSVSSQHQQRNHRPCLVSDACIRHVLFSVSISGVCLRCLCAVGHFNAPCVRCHHLVVDLVVVVGGGCSPCCSLANIFPNRNGEGGTLSTHTSPCQCRLLICHRKRHWLCQLPSLRKRLSSSGYSSRFPHVFRPRYVKHLSMVLALCCPCQYVTDGQRRSADHVMQPPAQSFQILGT